MDQNQPLVTPPPLPNHDDTSAMPVSSPSPSTPVSPPATPSASLVSPSPTPADDLASPTSPAPGVPIIPPLIVPPKPVTHHDTAPVTAPSSVPSVQAPIDMGHTIPSMPAPSPAASGTVPSSVQPEPPTPAAVMPPPAVPPVAIPPKDVPAHDPTVASSAAQPAAPLSAPMTPPSHVTPATEPKMAASIEPASPHHGALIVVVILSIIAFVVGALFILAATCTGPNIPGLSDRFGCIPASDLPLVTPTTSVTVTPAALLATPAPSASPL